MGGAGGWYHLIVFVFFLCFCFLDFVVSRSQSLYLGGCEMMAVVSVSLFFFIFLVSVPFN